MTGLLYRRGEFSFNTLPVLVQASAPLLLPADHSYLCTNDSPYHFSQNFIRHYIGKKILKIQHD